MGEKVEKDSSASQGIPSIDKINKTPVSAINDMHLDSNNKEDKIRHRNKSSDVASESQPSSEQSIDNKNTKMSDTEVRDENEGIGIKSKDESRSSDHQSLLTNDTKPLTTLKQSNKETKLDKEHNSNSKISVIKFDKSEQIVDSISICKENNSKEVIKSGTDSPGQDNDDKNEISDKASTNSDAAPVKKKVKSFASAMSLFLKSKKDTSYVENPVKGKKTVKKFKKRRGPKKFNQPAKSPNPNNSETKRGSRKKRKMGNGSGETRITRSSQRLNPATTENVTEEGTKTQISETQGNPATLKREGTPQLHMEEEAAQIVDRNLSTNDENNMSLDS